MRLSILNDSVIAKEVINVAAAVNNVTVEESSLGKVFIPSNISGLFKTLSKGNPYSGVVSPKVDLAMLFTGIKPDIRGVTFNDVTVPDSFFEELYAKVPYDPATTLPKLDNVDYERAEENANDMVVDFCNFKRMAGLTNLLLKDVILTSEGEEEEFLVITVSESSPVYKGQLRVRVK